MNVTRARAVGHGPGACHGNARKLSVVGFVWHVCDLELAPLVALPQRAQRVAPRGRDAAASPTSCATATAIATPIVYPVDLVVVDAEQFILHRASFDWTNSAVAHDILRVAASPCRCPPPTRMPVEGSRCAPRGILARRRGGISRVGPAEGSRCAPRGIRARRRGGISRVGAVDVLRVFFSDVRQSIRFFCTYQSWFSACITRENLSEPKYDSGRT
jgi:hypothetical protein